MFINAWKDTIAATANTHEEVFPGSWFIMKNMPLEGKPSAERNTSRDKKAEVILTSSFRRVSASRCNRDGPWFDPDSYRGKWAHLKIPELQI